ncbi:MAG: carbohydrate ABC transporter permease, partial [Clostridia bacterium]|nr:carbohydrate ABC transporter permease [Clostridia bacterium]
KDLVEAARIDGSHEFYTFNKIILPISAPALATQAIFSFVYAWNNYLPPLMILNTESLYTLPIWIHQLNADTHEIDYGALYAGLIITVLPLVIVYLAFSKFIVGGIAQGGVKE